MDPKVFSYKHSGLIPESAVDKLFNATADSRSDSPKVRVYINRKSDQYIFHNFVKSPHPCERDILLQYPLLVKKPDTPQTMRAWYIGEKSTGTLLHRHGPALNILSKGFKEWILFPPTEENKKAVRRMSYRITDAKDILTYLRKYKSYLRGVKGFTIIIQRPGTALSIPDGWYHAVLNLTAVRGFVYAWK